MSTIAGESVAHHNLRRILKVVRELGEASRREVARRTGLSTPTVTRHVSELVEAGVLRSSANHERGPAGPGRPPRALRLDPSFGCVLGVDVGEHTIRASVIDFCGEVVVSMRAPSRARRGREASLDGLACAVRTALERADAGPGGSRELLATAIGVPGIVDVDEGRVRDAPNFPGWQDLALRDLLRDRVGLGPHVRIDNDVNLATVGESAHGVGRGHQSFVFVSVRRGIGAGIVLGGQLMRGHAGMAGEIGFMAFAGDFDHRSAHGLGHLETIAGEQTLLERVQARDAVRWRGEDDHDGPSLRDLCLAAAGGDAEAAAAVEGALEHYGVAIANIVSLLDPALVVIGGDLAVIGETAVARTREVLRRLVPHAPLLRSSVLGEDAALQGAVHQAHVDACAAVPGVIHPLARGPA